MKTETNVTRYLISMCSLVIDVHTKRVNFELTDVLKNFNVLSDAIQNEFDRLEHKNEQLRFHVEKLKSDYGVVDEEDEEGKEGE